MIRSFTYVSKKLYTMILSFMISFSIRNKNTYVSGILIFEYPL